MNIILISPVKAEYQDIIVAVKTVVAASGNSLRVIEDVAFENSKSISNLIQDFISKSDLIIVDVTGGNPNVMFELGLAKALSKPIIIICQKTDLKIPFDLHDSAYLIYDRQQLQDTLIKPLRNRLSHPTIKELVQKEIIEPAKKFASAKTVFVSYSHVDTPYLERLKVHLKPFEKRGIIDLWVDTKIKAGEKWKEKIKNALDKSVIAILLISADFLASDFIIDNELPPILKSEEDKGKVILPVILRPCRFTKDEHLSKFQAINDPQLPLSKMDDNHREEIYVKIADYIDNLVQP